MQLALEACRVSDGVSLRTYETATTWRILGESPGYLPYYSVLRDNDNTNTNDGEFWHC